MTTENYVAEMLAAERAFNAARNRALSLLISYAVDPESWRRDVRAAVERAVEAEEAWSRKAALVDGLDALEAERQMEEALS